MTGTERELRALLAAVREAIDIPAGATFHDAELRREVLHRRAMYAAIALESVVDHDSDPGYNADYLRARLTEHPATGYRHLPPTKEIGQ